MPVPDAPERPSRETRLLLLIVTVSVAVLLLLARLRFPSSERLAAAPEPGPLAGLAGRASFDDLSDAVNTLLARVSPRLLLVELAPVVPDAHAARGDASGIPPPGPSGDTNRVTAALRVGEALALIPVPDGWAAHRFMGTDEPIAVVAIDPEHHLVLARPTATASGWSDSVADAFAGLTFVGAFSGTGMGLTVDPTFLGRITSMTDPRWPGPLWKLPDRGRLRPGTFVFSMDARLIGLATTDDETDVLVPASVLHAIVARLGAEAPARP